MIICDEPPFRGGQLNAVSYEVTVTGFVDATFRVGHYSVLRPSISGLGAISSILVDYSPPSELDSRHQWFLVVKFANYTYRMGFLGVNGRENINQFSWGVEDIVILRSDRLPLDDGIPLSTNCRCASDYCQVDCPAAPRGFCCIPHSLINQLSEVLQG